MFFYGARFQGLYRPNEILQKRPWIFSSATPLLKAKTMFFVAYAALFFNLNSYKQTMRTSSVHIILYIWRPKTIQIAKEPTNSKKYKNWMYLWIIKKMLLYYKHSVPIAVRFWLNSNFICTDLRLHDISFNKRINHEIAAPSEHGSQRRHDPLII